MNAPATLFDRFKSRVLPIVHTHDGPLTQQLVQRPAAFGLGQVPEGLRPDSVAFATCGFCSTGCGLNVHLKDGRPINVSPRTSYPVNLGMACPKGWEAMRVLDAPDRGTAPLLRMPDGQQRPVDWDTAIGQFCDRFQAIQAEHGPESIAFLSTGQIVCEEMAFLGSLAKFGMGMIHGDGNTRQCMATAATAYKQSFGFDAPPYTYDDFEQSDVLLIVGGNLCIAHPIMWQRVLRNPHNPEIIVVDPRRTETATAATEHLAVSPKGDLALLYGLANLLIDRGVIDRAFVERSTSGFEEFARFVRRFDLPRVAQASGIAAEQLCRVADKIAAGQRVSFWWTMGVNQSYEGTRTAQAIINLALMTGHIGRPGTGANSITGQCNAMGSRLFSNTSSLLGGRDFASEDHRREVAAALGIDAAAIPDRSGMAYDQIIDGIESGQIRGLWVIATNTAHSWANSQRGQELLGKLDFLVVQDMYHSTETAIAADLFLPAAGWGEKEGTFINSERRLGLSKRLAHAPGQSLADFSIFRLIAQRWGCGEMFKQWTSPAAAFELMKALSAGKPCDITGVADYSMIERCGGIQWPLPAKENGEPADAPEQQRRLFADGRFHHGDGRAKFLFEKPKPLQDAPDADYPLILLTGRGTVSQWHTQTRTAKSPVLRKLYPADCYIEVHPQQADPLGLASGDSISIESRRGSVVARAVVTSSVGAGRCFMPMHYAETNRLTLQHVDPYSRQPSYKNSAIRLRRIP